MSENPFRTFTVRPTYGLFKAVITFTPRDGYDGDVYIFRSLNGSSGWELLNPEAPVPMATGSFADTTLKSEFDRIVYYRGLLDPDGGAPSTWLAGPPVAPFEHLHPRQRRGANLVMRREYRRMSGLKTDGMRAFHLIPLDDGDSVPYYDGETGQLLGIDCPDAGTDGDGFGQPFVGGYHPPLATWVRVIEAGMINEKKEGPEAMRADKESDMRFRFLAHPRPRENHLIVLPSSDRRYAIDDPVTPYYFPGTTIPVAWEALGKLLDPSDPRCRIEMPAIPADPDLSLT